MKLFDKSWAGYRGTPFWSLNDRLEADEMIRQVEEFHRAGMGGFFLHSRIGLITEYLGKEWMDALRAAIEKAGELGMKAWLYDEDKWPSGFAGGIVPLQNSDFRGRYLGRISKEKDLPENAENVYSDEKWNYFTATVPLGIAEFNGTCYTDLMNPEAVKAYIESTHEKYKEEFGQYFGNVIPGIFTDEPIMRMRPNWLPADFDYLPYSPYLFERYKKNYGESPFLHLPELFEDVENCEKYRYRYWETATGQFVSAFTEQISEWCADNDLKLTGHYMYEDSIEAQTRWIGKAMTHYEHMQIPGIDHLGLNIDNILTAKQCSSVAHQQEKKQVLSEMFGAAGQNMSFEDRKWIAGWHGIMGINFVCHHLSLYSIRGCRKRDYPPTFSYHQPYWEDNKIIEQWQTKLCGLVQEGKSGADILIIHPAESGWCQQKGSGSSSQMQDIDANLKTICEKMFKIHREFDLADEEHLDKYGKVEANRITLGKMSYKVVIMPSMLTIRESTLNILKKFQSAGGTVISCGKLPELIDGEASAKLEAMSKVVQFNTNYDELQDILQKILPSSFKVSGKNSKEVFLRSQETEEGKIIFLFNSSSLNNAEIKLSEACYELDLGDNEEIFINQKAINIAPADTRVLFFKKGASIKTVSASAKNYRKLHIGGPWKLENLDLNALPVDFAEWSIDKGQSWTGSMPLIAVKMFLDDQKYSGPLWLRLKFVSKIKLPGDVFLASELSNANELLVNGEKIKTEADFYLDKCLNKTEISKHLKKGINEIEVKLDYSFANINSYDDTEKRYGTELETAFILGNFSVYGEQKQPCLPKAISHDRWPDYLPERRVIQLSKPYIDKISDAFDGELTSNGFPFYAGKVYMSKEFKLGKTSSCLLKFNCFDAITGKVFINGNVINETINSEPYTVDISEFINDGTNTIKVELKNSLRNLLGPHHHKLGELSSAGPYSFISRDFKPGKFVPSIDWGFSEKRSKQESWTDNYCVVRFGLDSGISLLYE